MNFSQLTHSTFLSSSPCKFGKDQQHWNNKTTQKIKSHCTHSEITSHASCFHLWSHQTTSLFSCGSFVKWCICRSGHDLFPYLQTVARNHINNQESITTISHLFNLKKINNIFHFYFLLPRKSLYSPLKERCLLNLSNRSISIFIQFLSLDFSTLKTVPLHLLTVPEGTISHRFVTVHFRLFYFYILFLKH